MGRDAEIMMRMREEHRRLIREWKIAATLAVLFCAAAVAGWLRVLAR